MPIHSVGNAPQPAPTAAVTLAAWIREELNRSTFTTQVEWARAAGFSPQVVSDLLGARRPVPWATVDRLAGALGLDGVDHERLEGLWMLAKVAWGASRSRLRHQNALQRAAFEDLPRPGPKVMSLLIAERRAADRLPYPLPIDDVPPLTNLYVELETQNISTGGLNRTHAGLLEPVVASPVPISEALANHQHLLIVGDPGSGKSTMLLQLMRAIADWWIRIDDLGLARAEAAAHGPLIPVRVTARALVGKSVARALADAVEADLGEFFDVLPEVQMFAEVPAPDVPWLVLVDGLDEVLDPEQRMRLIDALAHRVDQSSDIHRFLIFSRKLPSPELLPLRRAGIAEYQLTPFNWAQFKAFALAWFTHRPGGRAKDQVKIFLDRIERGRLQSVVSLPLLGTIALVVHDQNRNSELPASRTGLYREFVHYLLDVRQRTLGARQSLRSQLAPYNNGEALAEWLFQELPNLLERVAEIQLKNADQSPLSIALQETREAPFTTSHIFDWPGRFGALLLATGLVVEDAGGTRFLHQSLVEYLAAGRLAMRLPAVLEKTSIGMWISVARPISSRSVALFALARWADASVDQYRDVVPVLNELLDGNAELLAVAAAVANWGIPVPAEAEMQIANKIFDHVMGNGSDGVDFVRALARMPNSENAARLLRAIAEAPRSLGMSRFRAAVELIDRDDRSTGLACLETLAGDPESDGLARFAAAARLARSGLLQSSLQHLAALTSDTALSDGPIPVLAALEMVKLGERELGARALLWMIQDRTRSVVHNVNAAKTLVTMDEDPRTAGTTNWADVRLVGETAGLIPSVKSIGGPNGQPGVHILKTLSLDTAIPFVHRQHACRTLLDVGERREAVQIAVSMLRDVGMEFVSRLLAAEDLRSWGEQETAVRELESLAAGPHISTSSSLMLILDKLLDWDERESAKNLIGRLLDSAADFSLALAVVRSLTRRGEVHLAVESLLVVAMARGRPDAQRLVAIQQLFKTAQPPVATRTAATVASDSEASTALRLAVIRLLVSRGQRLPAAEALCELSLEGGAARAARALAKQLLSGTGDTEHEAIAAAVARNESIDAASRDYALSILSDLIHGPEVHVSEPVDLGDPPLSD